MNCFHVARSDLGDESGLRSRIVVDVHDIERPERGREVEKAASIGFPDDLHFASSANSEMKRGAVATISSKQSPQASARFSGGRWMETTGDGSGSITSG
jgi:hypothetical protein